MLSLSFFLLTAIVATLVSLVALSISREVALLAISGLKLFDALLKLAKMQFEILIYFSHLHVLFLEVLSTLI